MYNFHICTMHLNIIKVLFLAGETSPLRW